MKLHKLISVCIFSLVISTTLFSQKKEPEKPEAPYIRMKGVRVGIDLARLALPLIENGRFEYMVSADAEVSKKFFATVEIGGSKLSMKRDLYDYEGSGMFFKAGADYNLLNPDWSLRKDMFFVGLRYGYSRFSAGLNRYEIYDDYWGNYTNSVPVKFYNASWAEIVGGLRGQIGENFYLGFSVNAKILTNSSVAERQGFLAPGFGRFDKRINLGFSYSMFYNIPFWR